MSNGKITFAKPLADVLVELDRQCRDAIFLIAKQPGYLESTAVRHVDLSALEAGIADLRGAIARHAA